MRRQILLSTLVVAAAAIVVLGLPLALLGVRLVRDEETQRLDRVADTIGFAVEDTLEADKPIGRATLDRLAGPGRFVEVIATDGQHYVGGTMPGGSRVSVEVTMATDATVRVTASSSEVDERIRTTWLFVAGLGLAGLVAAVGLAVVQARRLTRPLEDLARVSRRLGAGDFSARAPRHGVPEADALADALDHSAGRIEAMVRAEREFSANASHQLRTPLTALRMHMEEITAARDLDEAKAEADAALAQADRLETTITALLALAREGRTGPTEVVDLDQVVRTHLADWSGRLRRAGGRRLVLESDGACPARCGRSGLDQVLEVLVDNAVRHGAGTVTVSVHRRGERAELRIGDEGEGIAAGFESAVFDRHVSAAGGSGVGLALARTLVEADGGRLELVRARPAVFGLLLPGTPR